MGSQFQRILGQGRFLFLLGFGFADYELWILGVLAVKTQSFGVWDVGSCVLGFRV